jgi:hypothetical protein
MMPSVSTVLGALGLDFVTQLGAQIVNLHLERQLQKHGDTLASALPQRWLWVYRRRLRTILASMPFIYHGDIDGEVLNDFVEITMEPLSLHSRPEPPVFAGLPRDPSDKIRSHNRVILLGDAGIGKTTFQRHKILLLLTDRKRATFIEPDEERIPLFVPLKLVDTTRSSPIVTHIVNSNALFGGGSRGRAKLERLARARKLFLFLDGYDEVRLPDGIASRLLTDELSQLFGSAHASVVAHVDPVVEQLRENRIWLSSRREFFYDNRFDIGSNEPGTASRLLSVRLTGLADQARPLLVGRVFDKYRARSKTLRSLLNEEYFLQDVDRALDDEIRKFSSNPLLLTILAFVYVQHVIAAERQDVPWTNTAEEIIEKCVNLLLVDLDAHKARELPAVLRKGVLRRRNDYPELKMKFLRYLSAQLYLEGGSAFSLESLRNRAIAFTKAQLEERNSTEDTRALTIARRQLTSELPGPDIALQLIYNGVFVVAGVDGNEILYDFAHRRFREVLALQYWTNYSEYCRMLVDAGRADLQEVLRFLRGMRAFQSDQFHVTVLEKLLAEARRSPGVEHFVAMSKNFFDLAPSNVDVRPAVRRFLKDVRETIDPQFMVSKRVLTALEPNEEEISEWRSLVDQSVREGQKSRFNVAVEVMSVWNPLLLDEVLQRVFSSGTLPGFIGPHGWVIALKLGIEKNAWTQIAPMHRQVLCAVVLALGAGILDSDTVLRFGKSLTPHDRIRLVVLLMESRNQTCQRFASHVEWGGDSTWLECRASMVANQCVGDVFAATTRVATELEKSERRAAQIVFQRTHNGVMESVEIEGLVNLAREVREELNRRRGTVVLDIDALWRRAVSRLESTAPIVVLAKEANRADRIVLELGNEEAIFDVLFAPVKAAGRVSEDVVMAIRDGMSQTMDLYISPAPFYFQ